MDIRRKGGESLAVRVAGVPEAAGVEIQVAELDERPGQRLRRSRAGFDREPHGGDGPARVTEELARVRDPRVRGQVRLERGHSLERCERLAVAAELDEGVPLDPVDGRGFGVQRLGTSRERERLGEAMA
jgi:hypothetical protein